jgi:hypothetical protein
VTIELPFRPLPIDQQDVRYAYGPDSDIQPGVPAGSTVDFDWCESTIYPGTTRRYWVHVPAQYDPCEPALLMVFQDGWWYLDPDGQVRGAIVLDNLIHRGEIPVTISVFVDPGVLKNAEQSKNRNAEYDAFNDRYVTFLLNWDHPPGHTALLNRRGRRPTGHLRWQQRRQLRLHGCVDAPGQVPASHLLPLQLPYPALIPNAPRKPLRIFMQAGHRDLNWNGPERNWLASNLRVAAALAEAGYDFRLVLGDGGHSPNHGGVLLADALRWLWCSATT